MNYNFDLISKNTILYKMENNKTVITGYVKYQGDIKVYKFFSLNKFSNERIGRRYIDELIEGHKKLLINDYVENKPNNRTKLKRPIFYRFTIKKMSNNNVVMFKNKAFIKKSINSWKLLSSKTEVYNEKGELLRQ